MRKKETKNRKQKTEKDRKRDRETCVCVYVCVCTGVYVRVCVRVMRDNTSGGKSQENFDEKIFKNFIDGFYGIVYHVLRSLR